MARLDQEALDDLNEAVSRLAHWVGAGEPQALLQMTQGYGAAVAASAAMRSGGRSPEAIALTLAEKAQELQEARSARHAGWLLLSIEVELMKELGRPDEAPAIADLLREIEEIGRDLMRRGTRVLVAG